MGLSYVNEHKNIFSDLSLRSRGEKEQHEPSPNKATDRKSIEEAVQREENRQEETS
jgi:hypothetical protein